MTTLHTAARQALPLLERDCASLLACHQDPTTGSIPANEPEVIAMFDEYVAAITALRAALEAQQEPVAWMWEYIGNDPLGRHIRPCARALHEMDPKNPPHPNHWRPVKPLYATPQPPRLEGA